MNEATPARSIGLIGGLGVGSAVFYYEALAQAHEKRGRAMNLVMAHAHLPRVRAMVASGDRAGLASYLASLIARMQAAGAKLAVLPAVAPHIAIAELTALSPLPLVNLIEEIKREIATRGLRRIALLGARYVIDSNLYGHLSDIEVVMPQAGEIEYIHSTYFDVAEAGFATAVQREGLARIAHQLIERDRVDSIILAGTDLALVFDETNTDFPHIDAARLHIKAIIDRVLA
jgi:aspartate racemase